MIAIDVNDPIADQLNDVADIEKHFPGLLKASVEWFKIYKIPDGKPENQFAFNGEAKPAAFAHKIIEEVIINISFPHLSGTVYVTAHFNIYYLSFHFKFVFVEYFHF